jgi:hypothetical protein
MKARILVCLVLGSSLMLGCSLLPNVGDVFSKISSEIASTGSGNVVSREFDLSGFDQVEVSNAFDVEITQADAFSVVVRVDENIEEYLEVVKQGSTLRIGLKPHEYVMVDVTTMEAEVTMPGLTGLELSGASHGSITGFESAEDLSVALSGASSLEGDIEAGDVRFDISGASNVGVRGSAGDASISVSGASRGDLGGFPVASANLEVSGASSVTVNTSGTLDLEVSGFPVAGRRERGQEGAPFVTASGIYVIVVLGGRQRQVGARIERRVGQRRKELDSAAIQRSRS